MSEEEIKEYLKNCTGCLRCEYFFGEDELGWGHCKLRDELDYIKNNKSNEEILKEFKKQIDSGNDYIHLWWKNAQGLLDLYEKEKEKNKELEKYKTYYEEQNEVNKKFISKDKIFNKIEEKIQYIGLLYQKNIINNNQWSILKDVLEDLQELLEEE